jgi:TonB family protein
MLYRVLSIAIFTSLLLGNVQAQNSGAANQSAHNMSLSEYALVTRDAIQQAWTTPTPYDAEKAVKGRVTVSYEIARDGKIGRVKLIKGSGIPEMDKSLIKAIKRAAPFPALPEELRTDKVTIKANFVIADLPTLPVIAINHELGRTAQQPGETSNPKKFIWGLPAGNAEIASTESSDPPRPAAKKYKWGL